MAYTYDDAHTLLELLESSFPYVHTTQMQLGGKDKASLTVWVSLDNKDTWNNYIFHNSRFAIFDIDHNNRLSMITKSHKIKAKLRMGKVKSLEHAAQKILKWAEESSE